MHSTKSRAKGVSASSFFDLKAELSKKEEEFARDKAAGKSRSVVGGVQRSDKKPTVWARQNKGVKARASRDVELEAISKPTLESARAALERKAKIYDKLQKGKSGGLNDKQYDALLVDFDSKRIGTSWESDSDDVDESLTVPKPPDDEDDPIIEYEDEFGRVRTARCSEVPRELLPRPDEHENDEDEDIIIRNPVNHFPVYEPSEERIAQIAKEHAEENNPLGVHYDASKEVRAKGAGFYQFSADEETRKTQMEELKAARKETEMTRQEMGAADIRPGEVEGMRDEDNTASMKSRAMEKRKREIEERRRLVDAKRRKVKGAEETPQIPSQDPAMSSANTVNTKEGMSTPVSNAGTLDPFAALEAGSTLNPSRSKGKDKAAPVRDEADDFLARLESEMFKRKGI